MILGIIIGVVILSLLTGLYNASKLKTIEITKSISIAAPREKVYDMISHLKKFPEWSPFLAQDPSQKYEVKGRDGALGVQFHWVGNDGKDVGYQEIVKLESNRFVGVQCDIQKPFKAVPIFEYSLRDKGTNTEVTQYFKLESSLIDALFLWVFGAKKEMEATNQQGLDLLKKALES